MCSNECQTHAVVTSRCALCQQNRELRNSHIIPEFFYKPVYEKNIHRFIMLSTCPTDGDSLPQKGIRELLLCADCERRLSRFEKYTAELFGKSSSKKVTLDKMMLTIHGVDYAMFKLCALSILWRSSVAKNDFFSRISLGPHEDCIRLMLLNAEPGPSHKYGFVLQMLLDDDGKVLNGLMLQPDMTRTPEGYRCCRFLYGGCLWFYLVASHTEKFAFRENFLNENGSLRIALQYARRNPMIAGLAEQLKASGKIDKCLQRAHHQ